jgi:hypothetical protein
VNSSTENKEKETRRAKERVASRFNQSDKRQGHTAEEPKYKKNQSERGRRSSGKEEAKTGL